MNLFPVKFDLDDEVFSEVLEAEERAICQKLSYGKILPEVWTAVEDYVLEVRNIVSSAVLMEEWV